MSGKERKTAGAPESPAPTTLAWRTNGRKTIPGKKFITEGWALSLFDQLPVILVNQDYSPQRIKGVSHIWVSLDVDQKQDSVPLRPRKARGAADRTEDLSGLTWIGWLFRLGAIQNSFLPLQPFFSKSTSIKLIKLWPFDITERQAWVAGKQKQRNEFP